MPRKQLPVWRERPASCSETRTIQVSENHSVIMDEIIAHNPHHPAKTRLKIVINEKGEKVHIYEPSLAWKLQYQSLAHFKTKNHV